MNRIDFQPIIYSILIVSGIIIGSLFSNNIYDHKTQKNKIESVIELIEEHYVDTLENDKFYPKIINEIMDNLDPHSSFISKSEFIGIRDDMQGSFSGIGIEFNLINDTINVVAAISGGPSEKLGILSGDKIIYVEDENVAGVDIKNKGVIKRLRGKKGTIVKIKIKRSGLKDLVDFSIKRDKIPLNSVDASFLISYVDIGLRKNIGYIKINRFSATTYSEFLKSVLSLLDLGMESLILDLRGNPGGYMHMATEICDEILEEDRLIVFSKGRNRPQQNIYSNKKGVLKNTDIIVLIDEGSASASEIIAGAIQDNDRGVIIGRRSFGKGLVQEQIDLNDGSAIRITTQRYYTPSGRCIQKPYKNNLKENAITDTVETKDSLTYKTRLGRNVYGGGGILPDIIIKRDTSVKYILTYNVLSKNWINEFCLMYSNKMQNKVSLKDEFDFIHNIEEDMIYNEFLDYINKKGNKIKATKGEVGYLKNLIKSNIGRNIWGRNTFYEIRLKEDKFIKKAINEIKKET